MRTQKPRKPSGRTPGGVAGHAPQEPYRLLFEANPHPMWVYDLETLAFLAVNDTAVRRYGYSREEFLGMTIKDIRPPEDIPALLENVARVGEGLDEAGIWRHRTKHGTLIEVEIVSHTLVFAGRRAELVLAQDTTARRSVARSPLAKEARYRVLFELESDAVVMIENETGRLLEANTAASVMYGYSHDELLDMRDSDLSAESAETRRITAETPTLPDRTIRVPLRYHRRRDGTVFPVEITGRFFVWEGRGVHVAAIRDVTERKQAEAEIEKLARVPGENPNPVLRVLRDGILVYANRASASLLSAWACQVGQRLPDPWLQFVRTASGSGSSHTAEANIEDRVLSLTFAPVAAEYVNVYGLDITARKHAEAALRESEAKLQSIFRATPAGIGVVVHRVLKAANQRLCEMVGYAEDELVNQSARLLYPTDEEFAYVGREKYAQIEATGVGTVETRWRRKDGTLLEVLLSSAPMEPDNWGAGVIFTALDITDRTRAAEERQRLEEQMRHAQKLESLGVLAGGIAHDFNNLLMAILGNADLALLTLPPASPARQHLQEIERASRRAADLCRQMLAYSGKGRFVVERHDLSELVREMAHMLEVSVSKRATVEYRFASDLPAVEADATQVRQIVMNLMTNASEALGDQRGTITVTTGTRSFDRAFLFESLLGADLAEGEYVYLEVADTGCGMDAATRERIFDPFFSTKFAGRGLGLAAVLGIVRGHGGAIRVQSTPAQGSTFTVLVPAVPGVVRAPVRRAGADTNWQGAGTVLLVDDEEMVRTVGTRMLEWSGFQVLTAADGDEALGVYRQHAETIVCVLLDLTMPGLSGEETFAELCRVNRDVRVVLSSGYDAEEIARRFENHGPAGSIQKPYTMEALQNALRRALA